MIKPAKSYQEQLDLLIERGLIVEDIAFAEHCLAHHNYYRLSSYRFPFTVENNPDQFRPGTRFEDIWRLYVFDRGLRHLILEATKRVEISVRSRLAYEMGHRLGPLAYLDKQNFRQHEIHAKTLSRLDEEMSRSKETFIKHHKETLKMDWPPIWVVMEVASFGTVSNILKNVAQPSVRQAVADSYMMDEKTFCSLFHHLSVVRNTAAHHSRLWNRRFTVTFQLPRKKPASLWESFNTEGLPGNIKERHIYNTLVLLAHLLRCIDPHTCWPRRLLECLSDLEPEFVVRVGAPENWKTFPIWA